MAASDTVPVLIGAAIGAGGAVLAQVVSSVFTGRHDTKRLTWDQGRQDQDWKIRKAERFLDLKQELYTRYLVQAAEFLRYIHSASDPPDAPRPESPSVEKLQEASANISLVAPWEVRSKVREATVWLVGGHFTASLPEPLPLEGDDAQQAVFDARDAMRADLHGDEDSPPVKRSP